MDEAHARDCEPCACESVMALRYGMNEAEDWWEFALGPHREQIWERLRELDTQIIRIFLFDTYTPDPVTDWQTFASCIQAILNVGATPMVTFARFRPPFANAHAVRWFANQCADVVWGCIEQWGGEAVRDWYWCVWDQPNSPWRYPGLTFEHYRQVYEEVAQGILRWLEPYLAGRKPRIGGPSVDGFQPFWWDWIWRLVHEIDNALIGFVAWNRFGEWRAVGEWRAPEEEGIFRELLLHRAQEYEWRSRAIARLLHGRGMLNICSGLNAHAHDNAGVSAGFNHTNFGAAYYASALVHLIQGGADAAILWTGTDKGGRYGAMGKDASLTSLYQAKKLCAQHLQYGDRITFPPRAPHNGALHMVVAHGAHGRQSVLLIHRKDVAATYRVSELGYDLGDCQGVWQIDASTGSAVVERPLQGMVRFAGYGLAVMTNARA